MSLSGLGGGLVIAYNVSCPHPEHTGVPVKNEALDICNGLDNSQSFRKTVMFQCASMDTIWLSSYVSIFTNE